MYVRDGGTWREYKMYRYRDSMFPTWLTQESSVHPDPVVSSFKCSEAE